VFSPRCPEFAHVCQHFIRILTPPGSRIVNTWKCLFFLLIHLLGILITRLRLSTCLKNWTQFYTITLILNFKCGRTFFWLGNSLKTAVFWDVTLCRSCVNRCFGGTYRLHLQGRKISERGTSVSRWLQARGCTQDRQDATSQNAAFFIVTAVKSSNLIGNSFLWETVILYLSMLLHLYSLYTHFIQSRLMMAFCGRNISWGTGVKFLNFKWRVALMTDQSV
jgi:hypothetical protein